MCVWGCVYAVWVLGDIPCVLLPGHLRWTRSAEVLVLTP